MTAAALLNDLAESLGNDLCKQFVTPEMESLSEVSPRVINSIFMQTYDADCWW